MAEPRREPVLRHARAVARHPLALAGKIVASVASVALVSSLGIAAIAFADISHNVQQNSGVHLVEQADAGETAPPVTKSVEPAAEALEGEFNVLLVGTDTRTGQGAQFQNRADLKASSGAGNNDVTMLLHIAQDHKSMMVVSFPRDLMVEIPDCPSPDGGGTVDGSSFAQFNTALSRGGLPCVVLTVEELTGLTIPFAATINFAGVSAMSSAVGGVTVCLASPVKDDYTNPPLDLPAGQQDLVGDTALSFLRSRHGVGDGSDLGRISNQQVFLSALDRKIVSGGVLSNPVQLYALAKAAVANVTPSDTLSNPTTLVQIAMAVKDTGLDNMVFVQYPTVDDPDDPNRVIVQSDAADALNQALVNDQPVRLTGSTGRAAEDPNATAAPTDPAAPDTAAPDTAAPDTAAPGTTPDTAAPGTAAPGATPAPTGTGAVDLPSTITGQTAAQQTCTKGND
jgi:LCP family protein required for cell wall assembly